MTRPLSRLAIGMRQGTYDQRGRCRYRNRNPDSGRQVCCCGPGGDHDFVGFQETCLGLDARNATGTQLQDARRIVADDGCAKGLSGRQESPRRGKRFHGSFRRRVQREFRGIGEVRLDPADLGALDRADIVSPSGVTGLEAAQLFRW
jgi:hypothetical protein